MERRVHSTNAKTLHTPAGCNCSSLWLIHFFHLSSGLVADVNVAIRKIATLLKPDKDIIHDGDHVTIKTLSTFKNYNMDFHVGKEFEEDLSGVDDRKCMVSILPSEKPVKPLASFKLEMRGPVALTYLIRVQL